MRPRLRQTSSGGGGSWWRRFDGKVDCVTRVALRDGSGAESGHLYSERKDTSLGSVHVTLAVFHKTGYACSTAGMICPISKALLAGISWRDIANCSVATPVSC